jgi:hypothetical protein
VPLVSFSSVQFPDIVVVLDDHELRVPGDIPIPRMIEIDRAMRATVDENTSPGDQGDALMVLYELLLGLFQIRQPDLTELPVGPRGLLPLALAVLNPESFREEAVPDPPAARRRAGTTTKSSTSSPKAKAKTRAKSTS